MRSMRDDEPRPVWTSCPSRTWSSRLGIEPKTPGWLVQDRTTSLGFRFSPSGIWSPPSVCECTYVVEGDLLASCWWYQPRCAAPRVPLTQLEVKQGFSSHHTLV